MEVILPMKLSPHPNTLLILFIFIDDLFRFIEKKQFKLPEHSVAGRDLKLSQTTKTIRQGDWNDT